MTTGKMIGRLKALKRSVLADGRVDWDETERLMAAIRPLAEKRGFLFQDYVRLLEKCREDGKITKEESEKLALQLDFLCSFFSNLRLKFWLAVTVILLILAATFAVGSRLSDSAAASCARPRGGRSPRRRRARTRCTRRPCARRCRGRRPGCSP